MEIAQIVAAWATALTFLMVLIGIFVRLGRGLEQLEGYGKRIAGIESREKEYLTLRDHELIQAKCQAQVLGRQDSFDHDAEAIREDVADLKTAFAEGEKKRIAARKEDDERWTKVAVCLAKVETKLGEMRK